MKDKEQDSRFVYMKFDTTAGKPITIATTRPELMAACVMVHVHPDDERYKDYVGKEAIIPFYNRKVPIKANKDVARDFGSGAVYHCTFGDMDDVKWLMEEGIDAIEIVEKDGRLNEKAGKYKGMTIKEARKAIIKDLEDDNRIEKSEPIRHVVNVHERCDTDIEILMTEQWFINYLDLKDEMLEWGKKLDWYPEFMRVRYDNWVRGLKWDWCISRQRFFGVPFPVWYCKECSEIILADENSLPVDPLKDKAPVDKCPKCGCNEFVPEKDVLDTWATSSLTPQIAVELMDEGIRERLYPMSLRPQAHDIITFWLFNTVVKSQLHNNVNPWKDVAISGHALDPHHKKMSKSKGNVVEPQAVIAKYSADALRFWAAGSKLGEDLPYQEKDIVTGQKFITKLWNASRFGFMHLEDYRPEENNRLEVMDRWLLSKLSKVIKGATESFRKYEYFRTKADTELFFWQTLCDNYLEIAKDRLYNPEKRGKEARLSAQYALYNSLLAVLKLMAPIMPFITEEIYQLYFAGFEKEKSIHNTLWPSLSMEDNEAEAVGDFFVEVLGKVRKFKAEKKMSLKTELKAVNIKGNITAEQFDLIKAELMAVTKAKEIKFEKAEAVEISAIE